MNNMNKKIIYFDSEIIVKNDIVWGLLELGIDVERAKMKVSLYNFMEEQVENIISEIRGYSLVISQNFSVNIAEACNRKGIIYISWVYDSPLFSLYQKYALYKTNFIFVFDKKQRDRIKALGCENIFYQPLAANIALSSTINITDEDIAKYQTDVSFVGKIYGQDFYESLIKSLTRDAKEDVDNMYRNIACKWDKGLSPIGYLKDSTIDEINMYIDNTIFDVVDVDKRFICEITSIVQSLAGYERKQLLNLSGLHYKTSLYTNSDIDSLTDIKNVSMYPPVSSDHDAYKVYFSSKININLTLRSIETGAPQRIFDIMSVGGPVFSNYQEELEELFIPDKEIVLFKSLEEFNDKAKYYLSHDTERVKIGINGYYRVRDEYNYPMSLKKMFALVDSMT